MTDYTDQVKDPKKKVPIVVVLVLFPCLLAIASSQELDVRTDSPIVLDNIQLDAHKNTIFKESEMYTTPEPLTTTSEQDVNSNATVQINSTDTDEQPTSEPTTPGHDGDVQEAKTNSSSTTIMIIVALFIFTNLAKGIPVIIGEIMMRREKNLDSSSSFTEKRFENNDSGSSLQEIDINMTPTSSMKASISETSLSSSEHISSVPTGGSQVQVSSTCPAESIVNGSSVNQINGSTLRIVKPKSV